MRVSDKKEEENMGKSGITEKGGKEKQSQIGYIQQKQKVVTNREEKGNEIKKKDQQVKKLSCLLIF